MNLRLQIFVIYISKLLSKIEKEHIHFAKEMSTLKLCGDLLFKQGNCLSKYWSYILVGNYSPRKPSILLDTQNLL